jgi:hypothetical protein
MCDNASLSESRAVDARSDIFSVRPAEQSRLILFPCQTHWHEKRVVVLDLDVMLGERESRILGFARGCELLFMHDVLAVPTVPQRQAPLAGMLLHGKLDVVILRFVAVPQSHESQYRGSDL